MGWWGEKTKSARGCQPPPPSISAPGSPGQGRAAASPLGWSTRLALAVFGWQGPPVNPANLPFALHQGPVAP